MIERLYLEPPEIVDVAGPVIFLAGPIQGAPDWQAIAADRIHTLDSTIYVANPRKLIGRELYSYNEQVDWETYYIERASKFGVVMFWLARQSYATPGRDYAQTSRFELGETKEKHVQRWKNLEPCIEPEKDYGQNPINLILGIEPGFGNERYIRRKFSQDCPDVPIVNTLAAAYGTAVMLLNKRY